jgi:hypothetical protein
MKIFIFQRPIRVREEDPEIRNRIKIGGIAQTPPADWSPEGWECIEYDTVREFGRTVIIRIWEQPSEQS